MFVIGISGFIVLLGTLSPVMIVSVSGKGAPEVNIPNKRKYPVSSIYLSRRIHGVPAIPQAATRSIARKLYAIDRPGPASRVAPQYPHKANLPVTVSPARICECPLPGHRTRHTGRLAPKKHFAGRLAPKRRKLARANTQNSTGLHARTMAFSALP
ncbi:hypothetical protein [Microbulbifer sp. JSM ZJ756]|uniref:hypothetical protein n=1 Tax=Microbulbifer sp. JSM ZJ756 TaxID=3376191 RepID=UPI0037B22A18